MESWLSSSGKDFIKRGTESKVARTSSSVCLGLGTGPAKDDAIIEWLHKKEGSQSKS